MSLLLAVGRLYFVRFIELSFFHIQRTAHTIFRSVAHGKKLNKTDKNMQKNETC